MSELSIFSLLVVGRDLPPTFIPTSGADYRPVDRTVPLGRQREDFKAKLAEPAENVPHSSWRLVS
jgi:hypothetical protein